MQKKDGPVSSTKHFPLEGVSNVLKLEIVDTAERSVICVREDGTLNVLSSDGTTALSTIKLTDGVDSLRILAAECSTLAEAQHSWLKSRRDLTAGIVQDSIIIACAYGKAESREIHFAVWTIPLVTSPVQMQDSIQPLFTHQLAAQLPQSSTKRGQVELLPKARLIINNSSSITAFDMSGTSPQGPTETKHLLPDVVTELGLSHGIRLCISHTKLQLYNQNFNSVLATHDLGGAILKRKRDQESKRQISLIAYFSHMKRVLASNGSHIIAVDIAMKAGSSASFQQSSLLIGNILRGSRSREQRNKSVADTKLSIGKEQTERSVQNWSLTSKDLGDLATKGNTEEFEKVFKKTFDMQRSKDFNVSKISDSKVGWLLSKIFTTASNDGNTEQKQYKITFLPHELLKWCISGGYLDNHFVDAALGLDICLKRPDALPLALADADPSLELVAYYLEHAPYLDPELIKLMIHVFVRKAVDNADKSHAAKCMQINSTALVTQESLELDSNTSTMRCLVLALKRFAFIGQTQVSKHLRGFDRSIILPLIQVLRQEMFVGGYGRMGPINSYPSPALSESEGSKKDDKLQLDLNSIVTVLNGCIDAIGPLGIFGGDDGYNSALQKIVPDLMSEIAAACRGVEDSTALQGILRETLRYVESVEKQPFEVRKKMEGKLDKTKVIKGQIVTLYAEPEIGESSMSTGTALPMSLKAEEDISGIKVRKGGQMTKRSAREIGMLRDRLKSAYSFERLVL